MLLIAGTNATAAFPGPLATDAFNRQSIDGNKRPNNKSDSAGPGHQLDPATTSSVWEHSKDVHAHHTDTTSTHGLFHYPMDPGHPTIPYNGPYNPDYKPTHPTVENVFHLSPHTEKSSSVSTETRLKEKTSVKTKFDAKKPVEPVAHKPHKDDYFPGPLAPDKFFDKVGSIVVANANTNENQQFVPGPVNPNKLPPVQKVVGHDQPQFVPLSPQQETVGSGFGNGGQMVPQLDNSATAGSPYPARGSIHGLENVDPNVIVNVAASPKKKASPSDSEKGKNPTTGLPGRPKQGQRNPEQEILPEELYHLINLQHPGLVQLEHAPPEGHPGLYDIHQQISNQKQTPNGQTRPGFFAAGNGPKKPAKPHVYAQKNEDGQTTYHIHTPDIPNSPQQIEELLAHIGQHDPNPGPFQHYPGQPAIPHNVASGPTATLPLHIDAHISHSQGLTHLNHPFAAQAPNQSGSSPHQQQTFTRTRIFSCLFVSSSSFVHSARVFCK